MLRFSAAVIVLVTSLTIIPDAGACNRVGCGIFGRGCRFSNYTYYPTYYQPQQYTPPISNFVFNNTYPVPYLSQQGSTTYGTSLGGPAQGYAMNALPYQVDVAGGFDRAGRLAEVAYQGGKDVMTQFNASLQNAGAVNEAAVRRQQIAAVTAEGIRAMAINPPPAGPPATMNFSATMQNGRMLVNPPNAVYNGQQYQGQGYQGQGYQGQGYQGQQYADPNQAATSANGGQYALGYNICATCHDGGGTHGEPKDSVYNGSRAITTGEFERAALRIELNEMPPVSTGVKLSPQDKAIVLTGLAKMVAAQSVAIPPPTAPVPLQAPMQGPVPNGGGQYR